MGANVEDNNLALMHACMQAPSRGARAPCNRPEVAATNSVLSDPLRWAGSSNLSTDRDMLLGPMARGQTSHIMMSRSCRHATDCRVLYMYACQYTH